MESRQPVEVFLENACDNSALRFWKPLVGKIVAEIHKLTATYWGRDGAGVFFDTVKTYSHHRLVRLVACGKWLYGDSEPQKTGSRAPLESKSSQSTRVRTRSRVPQGSRDPNETPEGPFPSDSELLPLREVVHHGFNRSTFTNELLVGANGC